MPRISSFYGIVIAMYFSDHAPPHIHAIYAGHEAQVLISTGELLNGDLPRRALGLVRVWSRLHRVELDGNWAKARAGFPLDTIEPLP